MSGRDGLTFRQDHYGDAAGRAAMACLLRDIFDFDISPLDRFGGLDPSSLPTAYFDGSGRCVANLSAFSMPMMIDGAPIRAAGWQSGAVRPEYRGRGLFADLIRATLARCDEAGFEAILLLTDKPGLYAPHGFVTLPQYRFIGPAPELDPGVPMGSILDLRDASDLALVRRVLAGRSPVSQRFAVMDQALMFLLNAWLADEIKLTHLDSHDAVIAWSQEEDGHLDLLDVVAAEIPPLRAIIAGLGLPVSQVTTHFAPDRLGCTLEPVQEAGDMVMMARGLADRLPGAPFRLSPMADF